MIYKSDVFSLGERWWKKRKDRPRKKLLTPWIYDTIPHSSKKEKKKKKKEKKILCYTKWWRVVTNFNWHNHLFMEIQPFRLIITSLLTVWFLLTVLLEFNLILIIYENGQICKKNRETVENPFVSLLLICINV